MATPPIKILANAALGVMNAEHAMLALSQFQRTHSLTPFRIGLLLSLFRLGRSSAATLSANFAGFKDDSAYRHALHSMRKQGYVDQFTEKTKDVTYSLTEKGQAALLDLFERWS